MLELVERVLDGHRIEDSLVEVKARWPDPDELRTAWQLGGMANAAGGAPVILIIGLDEDAKSIVDKTQELDMATWSSKIEKRFEKHAPEMMTEVHVSMEAGTVWAMEFRTDEAPYVVSRKGSSVHLERGVPWRVGTRTEPATHIQLLRTLAPSALPPAVDVVRAEATIKLKQDYAESRVVICDCEMDVVFFPHDPNDTMLLLAGRSTITMKLYSGPESDRSEFTTLTSRVNFREHPGPNNASKTALDGLLVTGVGFVQVCGSAEIPRQGPEVSPNDIPARTTQVQLDVELDGARLRSPLRIHATLTHDDGSHHPLSKTLTWGQV